MLLKNSLTKSTLLKITKSKKRKIAAISILSLNISLSTIIFNISIIVNNLVITFNNVFNFILESSTIDNYQQRSVINQSSILRMFISRAKRKVNAIRELRSR